MTRGLIFYLWAFEYIFFLYCEFKLDLRLKFVVEIDWDLRINK
jgi:hypothetical protein